MEIFVKFLATALILALLQTPVASGSIEGTVLDPDGRAVTNAEVYAVAVPRVGLAAAVKSIPDGDGRFVIRGLAPGTYRLQVTAPGYATQEYGAWTSGRGGSEQGSVITVAAGKASGGISIRLIGNAVISGRITGINGEPLLGIEVNALRNVYDATGVSLLPERSSTRTNDRGEYRMAGLTPGRYYIHAATPRLAYVPAAGPPGGLTGSDRFSADSAPADRSPGRYRAAFFPGVVGRDKAAIVEVQAGSERRNTDFSLPRSALYQVRGRVSNPLGIPIGTSGSFTVVAVTTDAVTLPDMSTIPLSASGEFTLSNIAAGDYWISASFPTVPPNREFGRGYARATIVDGDIDGVEITLLRTATIAGSVQVEGGSPASGVDVSAAKIDMRINFSPGVTGPSFKMADIGNDGTFEFAGLVLTEHRVLVSGPPGFYVKSATFGSFDALTQAIQVNAYPTPRLTIVLARGSEVSGTVTDSNGMPAAGQQVVLIPSRTPARVDLYKTIVADDQGRFTISGVAPGDYQAFAWKTIEPYRYFDSEYVAAFESQSTKLHLESSAPATIAVKRIP